MLLSSRKVNVETIGSKIASINPWAKVSDMCLFLDCRTNIKELSNLFYYLVRNIASIRVTGLRVSDVFEV
jgi:hypothetical protein